MPRSGPTLTNRTFIRNAIAEATGARISAEVLDAVQAHLSNQFQDMVESIQQAHRQEAELRAFHAVNASYNALVRPQHLPNDKPRI